MDWLSVWSKDRPLHTDKSLMQQLLIADGYDTGSSTVSDTEWLRISARLKETLGLRPGESIFDVGCGSGAFLYPFYTEAFPVGGIDYSPTQVAKAREHMPDAAIRQAEALDMRPDEKYDYVISCAVFHYFPTLGYSEQVLLSMLRKANRMAAALMVPDEAMKEQRIAAQRAALAPGEYEKKYEGIQHTYYDKEWFADFSGRHGLRMTLRPSEVAPYFYDVFLETAAKDRG